MVCPLCDTDLSQDGGLLQLVADGSHEIARACYSYTAFHADTAFPIITEAVEFTRGQIALYGTRAVWIRAKEVDLLSQRKTEIENMLNSRTHELNIKTAEAAEYLSKLQSKQSECEELKKRLASTNAAYLNVTGKPMPSMPLQQHHQHQQQQQQQRYPQQQVFGGGDMTPRRVSSPSVAMGGLGSAVKPGGSLGGVGRGIFNQSGPTRTPTPDPSLKVRTTAGVQLNLIRPTTASGVQKAGIWQG
jgi:hypothetical protein